MDRQDEGSEDPAKTGDPGRNGRFAAIDGGAYKRPCRTEKTETFCFVYPKPAISVQDTMECPLPWLFRLRYEIYEP